MKNNKVAFDREDTFSLNEVLNPIIAAGLRKFKETIISEDFAGYPIVFELSDEQKAMFKDEGYCNKISFNEWIRALDRMIYAFDSEEPELPDGVLNMVQNEIPTQDGYFPMDIKITNQEEYDRHNWLLADHERKVQEGLELFATYYKHLWW